MTINGFSFNLTIFHNSSGVLDYFCNSMLQASIIWAIFAVSCPFVGVPASAWLLRVLIQRHRSGLTNNVYMISLTMIDLIFNLTVIPDFVNYFFWQNKVALYIVFGIYTFNLGGRPLLTACVCTDSYMAVVHPITYMRVKHGRYRIITSTLVLLLCFFGFVQSVTDYVIITSLALSAPVIAFCNISVLCVLNKPDPSGRTDVHPQKQRALQVIIHSFLVSMLCYPSLLVAYVYYNVESTQQAYCYVYMSSLIPVTVGSCAFPLLALADIGLLKCHC